MNRFKNIFSASNPYKRLKKSNAKETKCRVEEFCSAFLRSYVSVVSISTEWKQMITEDSVKRKYILRYLKSNFHRRSLPRNKLLCRKKMGGIGLDGTQLK